MAESYLTDHFRQCLIDVIVALRKRNTPVACALALSTEEALNAISKRATHFAKERGDGHLALLGSRMVRFTTSAAYFFYTTYATLELTYDLSEALRTELELADLSRVLLRSWKPDDVSSPSLIVN